MCMDPWILDSTFSAFKQEIWRKILKREEERTSID